MNVEATARPNMPMQLTPLRGPEIGAFLTVSSGLSVFRSIGGGATDGQTVRPRDGSSCARVVWAASFPSFGRVNHTLAALISATGCVSVEMWWYTPSHHSHAGLSSAVPRHEQPLAVQGVCDVRGSE